MFDFGQCGGGTSGEADEAGTHVRGFAKKGSALGLEVENHETAEALWQFQLSSIRVQKTF